MAGKTVKKAVAFKVAAKKAAKEKKKAEAKKEANEASKVVAKKAAKDKKMKEVKIDAKKETKKLSQEELCRHHEFAVEWWTETHRRWAKLSVAQREGSIMDFAKKRAVYSHIDVP